MGRINSTCKSDSEKETQQRQSMKLLNKQPHTSESQYKGIVVDLHLDTDSTECSGAKAPVTAMKLRHVL